MARLVILDVNGTLFPLDPVQERLAAVGLPEALDLWFTRILRDGLAHAAAGTLAAFADLARHHLVAMGEERGRTIDDEAVDEVLAGFEQTRPHADVAPALRLLDEHGVTVVTLTNGTVEITRSLLERAGLDGLVAATYDVAMAGVWKPAAAAYGFVLDGHGVAASDAALVAIHPWDLHGAAAAGLATGWVNRDGARYPAPMATPDVQGASMVDVVDELLALTR